MPEIRSDYAAHLEGVQDIDKWVGLFLKDLKIKGLDKNTIIFFFSDFFIITFFFINISKS